MHEEDLKVSLINCLVDVYRKAEAVIVLGCPCAEITIYRSIGGRSSALLWKSGNPIPYFTSQLKLFSLDVSHVDVSGD